MPFSATAKFPTAIAQVADLLNQKNFLGVTVPTLAAGIGSGDVSFSCAAGTGSVLPTDNFEVTLEQEIIFVASRTGDVCSGLLRGVEGTSAASHLSGVQVNAFITALSHNQNASEINAIETFIGASGSNILLVKTVTITAAQLKTLSSVPPILIPAPGSGKTVVIVSAIAISNFGTVPFNPASSVWTLKLGYDWNGVAPFYNVLSITTLAASSALAPKINFTTKNFQPFAGVGSPATLGQLLPPDNRAVYLTNLYFGAGACLTYTNPGTPTGFSIIAGGVGFAVNDVFTMPPPQGTVARFLVTGVDSNGSVTSFSRITNTSNSSTNAFFYTPQYVAGTAVNPSVGLGLLIKITSVVLGLNGIAASNITSGQGGSGYAPGDTGTISPNSGGTGTQTATYIVNTAPGGVVTSYSITSTGTGYITAGGVATVKSTGAGTGLQIDITAIGGGYAPGDTGTWLTGGTYTVGTVDVTGNILTLSQVGLPTVAGPNGNATLATRGGSQPGVGTGLMFNPLTVTGMDPTLGDGSLDIILNYYIMS